MVFNGIEGDEREGDDEFDLGGLLGSGGGHPDPFYTQKHDLRFLA